MTKAKRLIKSIVSYEKKAISNLPAWYAAVGVNIGHSFVVGAEHFVKCHKETTLNVLKKLSPELSEFWEALQDVMPIPEDEYVSGEEFVAMVQEPFNN